MLYSNLDHAADLAHHIEITLQDATNSRYKLGLFLENEKIELEKKGDWTWTLVQRLYDLASSLSALTEGSVCVETFLRHL